MITSPIRPPAPTGTGHRCHGPTRPPKTALRRFTLVRDHNAPTASSRHALTEPRRHNQPPANRPVNSGPRPCLISVGFPLSGLQDRTLTSGLNAMPGTPAPPTAPLRNGSAAPDQLSNERQETRRRVGPLQASAPGPVQAAATTVRRLSQAHRRGADASPPRCGLRPGSFVIRLVVCETRGRRGPPSRPAGGSALPYPPSRVARQARTPSTARRRRRLRRTRPGPAAGRPRSTRSRPRASRRPCVFRARGDGSKGPPTTPYGQQLDSGAQTRSAPAALIRLSHGRSSPR